MLKIIVYLELIKISAKQLHYHSKGENFYSDHLLMDRIQENITEYIDSIKENCYMSKGQPTPYEKIIYDKVVKLLPAVITLKDLQEFITQTLVFINDYLDNNKDAAEQDLFGTIAGNLANSLGLLNSRLK